MDTFLTSSFGTVLMTLFQGIFSAPSWQSLTYLAYGWSLAWGRQTVTTSMWLSGAANVKHFSRYYVFLGSSLYQVRYRLWAQVIRFGASFIPAGEVIHLHIDDHTAKKSGRHIQGRDRYRNGAGSARQEYRILEGINLVLGIMRIPLKMWPSILSASPLAWNSLSNQSVPVHSVSPINPGASWQGASLTWPPSNCLDDACASAVMGNLPPKPFYDLCRPWSMWSGAF